MHNVVISSNTVSKIVTNDIRYISFHYFSEKIRHEVSCESYAGQIFKHFILDEVQNNSFA